MDIERANRILKEVAKNRGISAEEMIHRLEFSINEAIDNAEKHNNIVSLGVWKMVPCVGNRPTAAELIAYIGELMDKKMEKDFLKDTIFRN